MLNAGVRMKEKLITSRQVEKPVMTLTTKVKQAWAGIEKDFLIKELLQYNLTVFHFI